MTGEGCDILVNALATMAVEVQGMRIDQKYPLYSARDDGTFPTLPEVLEGEDRHKKKAEPAAKGTPSKASDSAEGEEGGEERPPAQKDTEPGCTCAVQ